MFSIVCVYNDGEILRKYLKKSLNFQTVPYELILVDNTENEFASAAKALNHGASKATGEYLMFIHQDVDLKSETWIEDTLKKLKLMPDLGIAGVAGKSEDRKGIISNVKQGSPPKLAGINQITESTRVQTLDECLLIIPKIVYQELKFDEDTCTGWHLYGVDYCLSVKKRGYQVYVLPTELYHLSPGLSFSNEYYHTLKKLLKKHEGNYPQIYTSMGDWNTSQPLIIQKLIQWLIRKVSTFRLDM